MLEQISTRFSLVLLDASLKTILLWTLALFAVRAFRKMSVHSQHRVWTVVLLAMLALPILTLIGPSWSLRVGNWLRQARSVQTDADVASVATNPIAEDWRTQTATTANGVAEGLVGDVVDRSVIPADIGGEARLDQPTGTTRISVEKAPPKAILTDRWFFKWPSIFVAGSTVWLFGVGVMLARFMIALFRVRRIRRAARLVTDINAGMIVRESDQIRSPVVVGWWRPSVLLPIQWREWTEAKRSAVFSHEMSHLDRRDTQLSLLAELVTLLYWFHPVVWWTKDKLGQLAELACDESAAIAIGDRLAYARYLIEVAAANNNHKIPKPGIAMARHSEIKQRVQVLLDLSRPLSSRVSRPTLATILAIGIPTVVLLAAIHPTAANPDDAVSDEPVVKKYSTVTLAQAQSDVTEKQSAANNSVSKVIVTDNPVLTLRGTVYLPDGSVAKDAILEEARRNEPTDLVSATIKNGYFEIKTTGAALNSLGFLVRSPDWNLQAVVNPYHSRLRKDCAAALNVTLETTKTLHVKVVSDDEQPVPGGHVQVMAASFIYQSTAGTNGIAAIKIPQDGQVFLINAWTDDHRIGGLHAGRSHSSAISSSEFEIEVSRGEPLRVRAVDADQKPVANVPLAFVAVEGKQGERFIGSNPTSYQTTNGDGEAVFEWVPNWGLDRHYVSVIEGNGWREIENESTKQNSKKNVNGVRLIQVGSSRDKDRVTAKGKLAGVTGDVTGLLVEFWGSPGEEKMSSDVVYARCDAKGNFAARVLPGSEYCVNVDDVELVSDFWDGIIALAPDASVESPEISLVKGVPVEIHATKGSDKQPIKKLWINLETPQQTRNRNRGHRFWGTTDETGTCHVVARAGELKIRCSEGDWEVEETVTLVEDEPAKLEVHRKYAEKKTIHGKLVVAADAKVDLSQFKVEIAGIDRESKDTVTVKADAQGNFAGEIIAGRVSIMATTKDESYFGNTIVDVEEGLIEVEMLPTFRYEGKVVDPDGQPLVGYHVHMNAWLMDHEKANPKERQKASQPHRILFHYREAVTDEKGHFVYPMTPQRIDLSIFVNAPGDEGMAIAWHDKYIEPGNLPSLETYRTDHVPKKDRPLPTSLKPMLHETLRDCRLARIPALVVIPGPGDIAAPFIKNFISDPKDSKDAHFYLQRTINPHDAKDQAEQQEVFAAHNWPFPERNILFLAVLDETGKELGRQTLNLANDQLAAKGAASFLKRHLPSKRDAKAEFEAALAEAKRSQRKVWVTAIHTSHSRDHAPNFSFLLWLDSQRELLAKDYVLFQFNSFLEENGKELSEKLKFWGWGFPIYAILDADGMELINSRGPQGNIGYPSSKAQIALLREMLAKTANHLSPAEIDSLTRNIRSEE